MPPFIDTEIAINEHNLALRLYAEGALYWPTGNCLCIADTHFGKPDHFQHAGIPIPSAVLDRDLARLTQLIASSGASKLIILGDFFHSKWSHSPSVLTKLALWRDRHIHLDIVLILGNHDLHAGPPPAELTITTVEAPYQYGPFICQHEPTVEANAKQGYVLAGHLHPYVVMRDHDGSTLRLTSFIFGPNIAILPAFGGFTGGSQVRPTPQDRVFALANGEIVEIPTARPRQRRRSG